MLRKTSHFNKFRERNVGCLQYHEEYQYLNLLNDIIQEGTMEKGRNGNVLTVFGSSMHFYLKIIIFLY